MRWDLIKKKIRNFKLLVHETWWRTSCPVIFKMYKNQIWSETYETCWDVIISHGEAVIKIWWGFAKVRTYDAYKFKVLRRGVWFYVKHNYLPSIVDVKFSWNLIQILSQCPHMITWHLDKFHNFPTKFVFYTI
jgi:hypothetical protein